MRILKDNEVIQDDLKRPLSAANLALDEREFARSDGQA